MNVASSRTEGKVYKGSGAVYSLRLEADGWMDRWMGGKMVRSLSGHEVVVPDRSRI